MMPGRAFLFPAAVSASLSAAAFHVQVGVSGYAKMAEDWIWETKEIGAEAETLSSETIDLTKQMNTQLYGDAYVGAYLFFVPGGGMELVANSGHWSKTAYGAKRFLASECVQLGTFGFSSEYQDKRMFNSVVTMRGDPYSLVWNDTGNARTINGERFSAGESKLLPFPVYLVMDEVQGVKFHDIESGNEITPKSYTDILYDTEKPYNRDGYYGLFWTGGIRISDGTSSPTNAPLEPLVFGGLRSVNDGKILYADNGMPVYDAAVILQTNIMLNTWWDFNQNAWNSPGPDSGIYESPSAFINDVNECNSHSTSHIIVYNVSSDGMIVVGNNGHVDFTMRLESKSGRSGSCVMRCWDSEEGATKAGYYDTPSEHRAECNAGAGTARFRFEMNMRTGTWRVYSLGN